MNKQRCSTCAKHDWETSNHRLDHYCSDNLPEFKEWKMYEPNNFPCWKSKDCYNELVERIDSK